MKTEPNILIKNAVFEAMGHIAEGLEPTAALKKVAESHVLNSNYIQRTGEVMNVILHQEHFKTAADRADTFPTADIPAVIKETYGSTEPTEKQTKSAAFVAVAESIRPLSLNKRLTNPKFKQAYMSIMNSGDKNDHFEMSESGVLDKSSSYILKLSQEVDRTATELVGAEREFTGAFSRLIQKFSKDVNYRTPFEEFESQVFATHGEKVMPYVEEIYKNANLDRSDERDARGVHDAKYFNFSPCPELQAFDTFLKAAAQLPIARQEAEDAKYNHDFEKSYLKEAHVKLAESRLAKDVPAPVAEPAEKVAEEVTPEITDPVLLHIEKKAAEEKAKAAPPEVKKAEEGTDAKKAEGLTDQQVSKVAFDMFSQLSGLFQSGRDMQKDLGPSKSNLVLKKDVNVDNVTRRAILQELIMTDPILSKVEPTKVIQAYEQLLAMAPYVAMQKEVVRAMLRTMVQGQAVSPYDASQAIEADLALMKHKLMQHGQHKEVQMDSGGKGR